MATTLDPGNVFQRPGRSHRPVKTEALMSQPAPYVTRGATCHTYVISQCRPAFDELLGYSKAILGLSLSTGPKLPPPRIT